MPHTEGDTTHPVTEDTSQSCTIKLYTTYENKTIYSSEKQSCVGFGNDHVGVQAVRLRFPPTRRTLRRSFYINAFVLECGNDTQYAVDDLKQSDRGPQRRRDITDWNQSLLRPVVAICLEIS